MLTQEDILDNVFIIIGDIQLQNKKRKEIEKNPDMLPMLSLREDLIKIAYELSRIWWARNDRIKLGYLPIKPTTECEELWERAKKIIKQILDLNSDV